MTRGMCWFTEEGIIFSSLFLLWHSTLSRENITCMAQHSAQNPPTSKNMRGVIKRTRLGGKTGTTMPRKSVQWCVRQPENDDSLSAGGKKIVRCHLQALGIPRYSFWHGLQTQTLAVHMRAGTAALVRTSTGRSSAQQQQQHRSNQSQEPARRSTLPRPGRKHHIHWNYSPKARFRVKICWGSLCGS